MCCCIPSKCLKIFIFIAIFLLLGIGAVLIWGGYQLLNFAILISFGYSYIGYIFIGIGSGLIVLSLLGFFGAWKEKKLLLSFFILAVILIGILLIAFGAGLIYARTLSSQYLSSESDCLKNYSSADDACQQAENALCKLYCPCKATNNYVLGLAAVAGTNVTSKFYVYPSQGAANILQCQVCMEINGTDNATYTELVNWVQSNLGYSVSSSNCSISASQYESKYFSGMESFLPLLKWVEESFSCSGLCTKRSLYLFSDVNNGDPSAGCMPQLRDWIQANFLTLGIVGIVVGAYMVVVVFFSCTLCCCSKKKGVESIDYSSVKENVKTGH